MQSCFQIITLISVCVSLNPQAQWPIPAEKRQTANSGVHEETASAQNTRHRECVRTVSDRAWRGHLWEDFGTKVRPEVGIFRQLVRIFHSLSTRNREVLP